jgi:hypothetical protein
MRYQASHQLDMPFPLLEVPPVMHLYFYSSSEIQKGVSLEKFPGDIIATLGRYQSIHYVSSEAMVLHTCLAIACSSPKNGLPVV